MRERGGGEEGRDAKEMRRDKKRKRREREGRIEKSREGRGREIDN